MRGFRDLEVAIFCNDEATKIKINKQWFEEQIRNRPVVDEYGDPLILSMKFMEPPVEFSEDIEDFDLLFDS